MVVPLHIPPLKERREDIPALARYFVDRYNSRYGLNFVPDDGLIRSCREHDWPGNVRELENVIERMVVLQSDDVDGVGTGTITVPELSETQGIENALSRLVGEDSGGLLDKARELVEKPLLAMLMSRLGDNQSETAKALGISRNTLASSDLLTGFI